ncbi:hypothetical protein [Dysgonomonas sp. 511]|uniref:hypothetical protein n=1 Tax=Dysgonomonas sp. 511 TaxID=2302930 RepID=UPI0013D0CD31|nr:hypothetical protein [Dysgonomonas sp. 511]
MKRLRCLRYESKCRGVAIWSLPYQKRKDAAMIFDTGIKGMGYTPDDEDIFDDEDYDESAEDRMMERYYEEKNTNQIIKNT